MNKIVGKWLVLSLLLIVFKNNFAQESSLRCMYLKVSRDTITIDSLAVFEKSLPLDKVTFFAPNKIVFKDQVLMQDSILICFRVLLPNRVKESYQIRNPIENNQTPRPITIQDPKAKEKGAEDKIYSSGSVSRGISAGNNQGLLVNSDLNLQMQGNLGKGVMLSAAVSDNNSPLQPDGTTLQIQDFDKVFVKIAKDSWFAVAGDYFMASDVENHFLRFNKKSRGLQFEGTFVENGIRYQNKTHAAISRGRFARNEIQGVEGLQGPYRLSGSKNEAFIIVIAATEVVYLDGRVLKRGEQNDYVINYNTAEVSFNPSVQITRYNRIVVEFQYADQSYSRIVFNEGLGVQKGKLKFQFNYFIEQDNKNQPFQAENALTLFDSTLNESAKSILNNAGDDLSRAVISTYKENQIFDNGKILYKKIDSLGNSDILVYQAADDGSNTYVSATFTLVGAGKGNYIQVNSTANGRVYAWVAPIAGIPQGNYEPIIQLVAPIRQQFATAAMQYQIAKNTLITSELAYSQYNSNTFSVLDKRDDDAFGGFVKIQQSKLIKDSNVWSNQLNWERISSGFVFIERYRTVEFSRLWSRSLSNPSVAKVLNAENILTMNGSIKKAKNSLTYELPIYSVATQFFGISPSLGIKRTFGNKVNLEMDGNYLSSQNFDSLNNTAHVINGRLTYQMLKETNLSVFIKNEESQVSLVKFDSMSLNSFQYKMAGVNLESQFAKIWNIGIQGDFRQDALPIKNKFQWVSDAYNINFRLSRIKGNKRIAMISNARFLKQDLQIFQKPNEQFLLQRIEYQDNNNAKGYQINFYLQSGTGREQKREFVFLEVPAGLGQYSWIDYNGNDIRELNEFELAVFKDQAKFIRVYNLTNDFLQANQHEANLSLRLRPVMWFKKSKSKLLQNINNQSNLRLDQRNTSDQLLILNPLKQDTQILSGNSLIRNTLMYNGSKFGAEITNKASSQKQLLTYGSEENIKNEHLFKSRYNLSRKWQTDIAYELGKLKLENLYFTNRNYDWSSNVYKVSLTWQEVKQRATLLYTASIGDGSENGADTLFQKSTALQFNYFYNVNTHTSLDAGIVQTQIDFNGNANSPLGFQILNGLQNGSNLSWNFNLRTLISKNIQFTFGYEGRKLPEIDLIHIGRVEARYLF